MRATRKVFLDSSVLFSAVCSSRGFANDLLLNAQRGRVGLVLSDFVLVETERNLGKSAPWAVPAFVYIRRNLNYRLCNPSQRLIVDTARVIVTKDAPFIAAARSAHVKLARLTTASTCSPTDRPFS